MKRRFWKITLLLAVPLALYAYIVERNTWRPKTILSSDRGYRLSFSPDGRYLAMINDGWHTIDDDWIWIYDMAARRIAHKFYGLGNPSFIGSRYLAVQTIFRAEVRSLPNGALVASSPEEFALDTVLPDGKTLIGQLRATGWGQAHEFVWDFTTRKPPKRYYQLPPAATKKTFREFELLKDGQTLLIKNTLYDLSKNIMSDTGMQFWDVTKQRLLFQVSKTTSVAGAANGWCAFPRNNDVEIWNCQTGHRIKILKNCSNDAIALSPDGTLLAGDRASGPIIDLWDTKLGQVIRSLPTQPDDMSSLAFSPDGRTLASSDYKGTVKLWRIK